MTAVTTARRVLAWAISPAGPLPAGPLWETERLTDPGADTLAPAAELARVTAARLGTGRPPFGGQDAIGLGAVLLAAAAGARRQPEQARRLAELLPATRPVRARPDAAGWYDLVARHGVVTAVLTVPAGGLSPVPSGGRELTTGGELTEALLGASPLTALLHRPVLRRLTAGTTGDEVEAAAALVQRPHGRSVLSAALSRWSPEPAVLDWRVELLDRLRGEHPDLILDTYTLARLRHGTTWDERIAWAKRTLAAPGPPDPMAIATVRFWVPLARLRQHGIRLADVRPLLAGYRPALQLVSYYRLLTTGAA